MEDIIEKIIMVVMAIWAVCAGLFTVVATIYMIAMAIGVGS